MHDMKYAESGPEFFQNSGHAMVCIVILEYQIIKLIQPKETRTRLQSAMELLAGHPWFKRVWTFQEFVLASRPVVCCGFRSINWKTLVTSALSAELFLRIDHSNMEACDLARSFIRSVPALRYLEACHGKPSHPIQFTDAMNYLFEAIIGRFSTNPKDRIYGLYATLSIVGIRLPPVDYRKSLETILEEFAFGIIQRDRNLLILSRFGPNCVEVENLPSWVPTLQQTQFADDWPARAIEMEKSGFPFFRPEFHLERYPGLLVLEGVFLGKVTVMNAPFPELRLLKWLERELEGYEMPSFEDVVHCLHKIHELIEQAEDLCKCPNGQAAQEAFAEVLKACPPSNQDVESTVLVELVKAIRTTMRNAVLATSTFVTETLPDPDNISDRKLLYNYAILTAYLKPVALDLDENLIEIIASLLFKVSQKVPVHLDNGCIGLAEKETVDGDLVVLFHGATLPLIVRPSGSEGNYRFVGRAILGGVPRKIWPGESDAQVLCRIVLE